jgi:hypothetical protein
MSGSSSRLFFPTIRLSYRRGTLFLINFLPRLAILEAPYKEGRSATTSCLCAPTLLSAPAGVSSSGWPEPLSHKKSGGASTPTAFPLPTPYRK